MLSNFKDKLFIFRHKREIGEVHKLLRFWVWLLVIWGFYRVLFRFPVWMEELILKPAVFLLPLYRKLKKEQNTWKKRWQSIGVGWKNMFAALAYGLSLGVFYLFVGRMGQFLRFGAEGVNPYGGLVEGVVLTIVLAFATAVSEEVVFMGYLLPRLMKVWKDEWKAASVVALLFALLHMPILVFSYGYPAGLIVGQFLLTFVLGFGNSVLMLRLNNIVAPIMSHALWAMAALMFR